MNIYGIWKDGSDGFIFRAAVEKQTQRTDLQTQRAGGEEEMCGESDMETSLPHVNRQPMGILCMTQGTQTGALWGGMGREVGGRFKREGAWLILVEENHKLCRAIILHLKKKNKVATNKQNCHWRNPIPHH